MPIDDLEKVIYAALAVAKEVHLDDSRKKAESVLCLALDQLAERLK